MNISKFLDEQNTVLAYAMRICENDIACMDRLARMNARDDSKAASEMLRMMVLSASESMNLAKVTRRKANRLALLKRLQSNTVGNLAWIEIIPGQPRELATRMLYPIRPTLEAFDDMMYGFVESVFQGSVVYRVLSPDELDAFDPNDMPQQSPSPVDLRQVSIH